MGFRNVPSIVRWTESANPKLGLFIHHLDDGNVGSFGLINFEFSVFKGFELHWHASVERIISTFEFRKKMALSINRS